MNRAKLPPEEFVTHPQTPCHPAFTLPMRSRVVWRQSCSAGSDGQHKPTAGKEPARTMRRGHLSSTTSERALSTVARARCRLLRPLLVTLAPAPESCGGDGVGMEGLQGLSSSSGLLEASGLFQVFFRSSLQQGFRTRRLMSLRTFYVKCWYVVIRAVNLRVSSCERAPLVQSPVWYREIGRAHV